MNCLRYVGLVLLVLVLCGSAPLASEVEVQVAPQANPWTGLKLKNNPDHFQFAIVSDRTGGHRPGVFEDAVRKLNLLQPEFVMSIGDLIDGYTEDEAELDRQWTEFEGFVEQLEMPFFYVPGNHDISNQVTAEVWKERFGRSYYHFVYRDVLFLCLNTEDSTATHIGELQITYVSETLAENRDVRWTLVFLHKPLWLYKQETGWKHVEALLQDRPYTVFTGHYHAYTQYERHNRRYFVLATTGGGSSLRGPLFGQFDHVVWVTMTDQGPRVTNLLLKSIWDEKVRTQETAALIDGLVRGDAISFAPILTDQTFFNGATSRIRIANEADVPMKARASFEPNATLRPIPDTFDRVVLPNAVEVVELQLQVDQPAKVADFFPLVLNWAVMYELPDRAPIEIEGTQRLVVETLFECPHRTDPVVVDGRLDEWPELPFVCRKPAQIQLDPKAWQGPDDSWFRFAVEYDEEYLYIAVETNDDRLVLDPDKRPWRQDGIEVRVDARPDPERSNGRGQGQFSEILFIALSPGETSDQMVYFNREKVPEGVQAICVKTATGHAVEIAVPAAYLNEKQGEPWKAFRLNIAVDDYDEATGPGAQIWWRPDWRRALTYPGSGTFQRRNY